MNMTSTFWIVLAGILAVSWIAGAVLISSRKKQQSLRLQQRFGPEYSRAIDELGSRAKAESELKAREERVEPLNIVALAPPEAARFSQAWSALLGHGKRFPRGGIAVPEFP
jgi:hypothetical protein